VFDMMVHVDKILAAFVDQHGSLTYGFLFIIIFIETGLVIMPFLPGDSLLFAVGDLAAMNVLDGRLLAGLLPLAAFTGDNVNYWIGRSIGQKAYELSWVNRGYLDRAEAFYQAHGPRTIILARFVPIVRTFAPFVAGIGQMAYGRFLLFSVAGAILWVMVCGSAGYFLGSIPVVKRHFEIVMLAIVFISSAPVLIEVGKNLLRSWRKRGE
jgi:membrane-associated protein